MLAENAKNLEKLVTVRAGLGSCLWLDLRGAATPRLTADRRQVLPRADLENWPDIDRIIDQAIDPHLERHSQQIEAALGTAGACRLLPLHLRESLLAEAFQPSLQFSYPPLGCGNLRGSAGNGILSAPTTLDFLFEADGRTTALADPEGREPSGVVLRGYDLVFPFTNISLGRLRRELAAWRTDRAVRPLGVLPFFLVGPQRALADHAESLAQVFQVPTIQALLPKPELWGKPFAEWSEEDWRTCGLSALWDIPTGQVLWAEGAHTTQELRRIGKPFAELLKAQTSNHHGESGAPARHPRPNDRPGREQESSQETP